MSAAPPPGFPVSPRGPFRPPAPPVPPEEATAWVGMLVFLGSWAMMFASLFFAYGALRLRLSSWPPAGAPPLPLGLALFNTVVIAASSWALERSRRAGVHPRGGAPLGAALGLGLTFLVLQALLWWSLLSQGLHFTDGTLGGVVYGLVAFHGAHVLVGLLGLGSVWRAERTQAGRRPAAGRAAVAVRRRLWTAYWHFVGVVWGLIFLSVFVL